MSSNAHTLMKEQLESFLNRTRNLTQLLHILHETLHPLTSINRLPTIPQLCVYNAVKHASLGLLILT